MAKKDKEKKGTKKICLGPSANFFHDPYTNVAIAKGEVKELEPRVLSSKRVRQALASGHLQVSVSDTAEDIEIEGDKLEALKKKIAGLHKSGKDAKKTSEAFNMEELVAIAENMDIEKEDDDTKETLVEAIFGKLEPKQ